MTELFYGAFCLACRDLERISVSSIEYKQNTMKRIRARMRYKFENYHKKKFTH